MKAILILALVLVCCCNDRGSERNKPIDTTIVIIDTTSNPVDSNGISK